MGQLINGEWIQGSVSNNSKDGGFKRLNSVFRNNISIESSPATRITI